MASASDVEQNQDTLANLFDSIGKDIRQNYERLRQLNISCRDAERDCDRLETNYLLNINKYSEKVKKKKLQKIDLLHKQINMLADDKFNLAVEVDKMVNEKIKMVDDKMKTEYKIEEIATRNKEENFPRHARKKKTNKKNTDITARTEEKLVINSSSSKSLKKASSKSERISTDENPSTSGVANPVKPIGDVASGSVKDSSIIDGEDSNSADIWHMPVDPNEPKYCVCNQVSFGKMIGCDNPNCPIEWCHFECVNIIKEPKGKWFCPRCIKAGDIN